MDQVHVKPELGRNEADVAKVLFPEVHGKLKRAYHSFKIEGKSDLKYLEEADDSSVPVEVTSALRCDPTLRTKNFTSSFLSFQFNVFFSMFQTYGLHTLDYEIFNNFSDVTLDWSRPDTLCVAYGRTLLVGEDKFRRLEEAEQSLRNKVKTLPPIYYGEMEFILGYIAADWQFQWVYIGRNYLRTISPCLKLAIFKHRCMFYLSLGYAYHLLCSMVDAMPVVPSNHAMFDKDENGDRTIDFFPDHIRRLER